MFKMSY